MTKSEYQNLTRGSLIAAKNKPEVYMCDAASCDGGWWLLPLRDMRATAYMMECLYKSWRVVRM